MGSDSDDDYESLATLLAVAIVFGTYVLVLYSHRDLVGIG